MRALGRRSVRGASDDEPGDRAVSRETDEAFEARAESWAASQFEQARAQVAEAGEQSPRRRNWKIPTPWSSFQQSLRSCCLTRLTARRVLDGDCDHSRGCITCALDGGIAGRRGEAAPLFECKVGARDAWRLLDIADGVPQVYAATSEEFVAQMLNLDALGGISFEKGCYTGQEVIARAHYRGRVKRRMQRFLSRGPAKLAVGESGVLRTGGRSRWLRLRSWRMGGVSFWRSRRWPRGPRGRAADEASSAGADAAAAIDVEPCGLPYCARVAVRVRELRAEASRETRPAGRDDRGCALRRAAPESRPTAPYRSMSSTSLEVDRAPQKWLPMRAKRSGPSVARNAWRPRLPGRSGSGAPTSGERSSP